MWIFLLLASLAIWRVSHMIAHEDGPFDIFGNLRERAGAVYYPTEDLWVVDESDNGKRKELGWLLTCPLCISIWIAIIPGVYMALQGENGILWWLGLSGASSFMELLINRRS
jgi:hypothetical protein